MFRTVLRRIARGVRTERQARCGLWRLDECFRRIRTVANFLRDDAGDIMMTMRYGAGWGDFELVHKIRTPNGCDLSVAQSG